MPSKKVSKIIKVSKVTKVLKPKLETKKVAKKVKSTTPKKVVETKSIKTVKSTGPSVQVYNTSGNVAGTITLPKEIFGQKPNKSLLSQAMHIYFTNSSTHLAHTKTRGEVRGGGRKPWKQKGTGNARAGSKRSPLWVGGGQVFGPKYRDVKLSLPTKMKKMALISALSTKAQNGEIKVIANFEKIGPKTKNMAVLLQKIEISNPVLLITTKDNKNIKLASRNIQRTSIDTPNNLNAFQVLQNRNILISKEALEKFI